METTLIPKCDGGLRIVGDSMYPLLKSGDIVFYKQVHDIMHSIIWGEMYLISFDIDGDEYVSVKYLQNPIYLITSCWSAITSTTNRWRYTSTASGRLLLSRRRCVWTRSNRGQIGHYTIKPAQTTFKWSCGLVFVVNYHWILRLRIELGRFALKFLHWNYGKLRS